MAIAAVDDAQARQRREGERLEVPAVEEEAVVVALRQQHGQERGQRAADGVARDARYGRVRREHGLDAHVRPF